MGNVYYRSQKITVRDSLESDMDNFIPNIREKEIRETFSLADCGIDEAVRGSYELANKRMSVLDRDGNVLIMLGAADLIYNCGLSSRLGLLDGYGGTLFSFSTDKSTDHFIELVRRAGPVVFRELKAEYDFLTAWVADYMTELQKLVAMNGFQVVEIAVSKDGTIFKRIDWHRS